MISRKIEIFLIIIGLAIFVFFGVTGVSMIIAHNDEGGAATGLYETFLEDAHEQIAEDQEIPTFDQFVGQLRTFGIMILVLAIIAIVVGIAGILMFKHDKKPKLAGLLLLIVGVFVALLQFAVAILGSLVYIIAGLMGVFRKPKLV